MRIFLVLLLLLNASNLLAAPDRKDTLPGDHPLILELSKLDLTQYKGKPVDTLMSHLPPGFTSTEVVLSVKRKRAAFLYVAYSNDVVVVIGVDSFRHMDPYLARPPDPRKNWNVDLFKKELVSYSVIFNFGCINGCEYKNAIQ